MNAMSFENDIVIVSGLPRSGTSMMMRMLEAGGVTPLTDAARAADPDNPRGYYEYEPVKRLDEDSAWMALAVGKALKVVSFLLEHLPGEYHYSVIFMERAVEEVLASQRAMLLRRVAEGKLSATAADHEQLNEEDARLKQCYVKHLRKVSQWLAAQPNIRTLFVAHRTTLQAPGATVHEIVHFLDKDLNMDAMKKAVEPQLYRQRAHPQKQD